MINVAKEKGVLLGLRTKLWVNESVKSPGFYEVSALQRRKNLNKNLNLKPFQHERPIQNDNQEKASPLIVWAKAFSQTQGDGDSIRTKITST